MNLSKTASLLYTPLLFVLEYMFKFFAGVGAAIVLAAEGSFIMKTGAGFNSLIPALRQISDIPGQLGYIAKVVNDYQTLTAASFNERYGGEAVSLTMDRLNEGVNYIQDVYQNLTQQPVTTITASIIVFLIFYLIGRISRFTRQRGKGSVIDRVERKLGQQVFEGSHNTDNIQ